jgi:hypothetical protein
VHQGKAADLRDVHEGEETNVRGHGPTTLAQVLALVTAETSGEKTSAKFAIRNAPYVPQSEMDFTIRNPKESERIV